MSKPKVIIDAQAIEKIRDAGIRTFHDTWNLGDMKVEHVATYLNVQGLFDYLTSLGMEPQFEIKLDKVVKKGD